MSATSWRLKNVFTALKIHEVIPLYPNRNCAALRRENIGTLLDEIRLQGKK